MHQRRGDRVRERGVEPAGELAPESCTARDQDEGSAREGGREMEERDSEGGRRGLNGWREMGE